LHDAPISLRISGFERLLAPVPRHCALGKARAATTSCSVRIAGSTTNVLYRENIDKRFCFLQSPV
jgi:hypothetical protein